MTKRAWLILAVLCVAGCSLGQQSKEQREVKAQLIKYKKANPAADLQQAWAKGDLRFVGVHGYSLSTPGVNRGEDGGFIHLVGINPIEGTTDFIRFSAQEELNEVADSYANRYNSMLFQKLKTSRKTNPTIIRLFRGIEQELKSLEAANPRADFLKNIQKKDFRFIYVYDTGLEGVSDKNFDLLKPYELQFRELKGNKDLLTKQQCVRLQQVIQIYIRLYNTMLFDFLVKRSNHKR